MPLLDEEELIILKNHIRSDECGALILKDFQVLFWKYNINPERAITILSRLEKLLTLGELVYVAFLAEKEVSGQD